MNFEQARFNMIEQQIRPWQVNQPEVLSILSTLRRENFVQAHLRELAFADIELPLPGGQTMLCPRIEARLVQELAITKKDKVLEIGSGSGYVTALLAKLADFVYSIEINEDNKQFALNNLSQAGIKNVSLISGNGEHGLDAKAPFDKILVGGSLTKLSPELKAQLKVGGSLIAILGHAPIMHAVVVKRLNATDYVESNLFETTVAPLITTPYSQFKF